MAQPEDPPGAARRPAPPSRRARERLAGGLADELAATRAAFADATRRGDDDLRAADLTGAVRTLEDQRRLLRLLEERLEGVVAAAAVEREAEWALADHDPEPVAGPAASAVPVPERPGTGAGTSDGTTTARGRLRAAACATAVIAVTAVVGLGAARMPVAPAPPSPQVAGAVGDTNRAATDGTVAAAAEDAARASRTSPLHPGGSAPQAATRPEPDGDPGTAAAAAPGAQEVAGSGDASDPPAPEADADEQAPTGDAPPTAADGPRDDAGDAEPDEAAPEEEIATALRRLLAEGAGEEAAGQRALVGLDTATWRRWLAALDLLDGETAGAPGAPPDDPLADEGVLADPEALADPAVTAALALVAEDDHAEVAELLDRLAAQRAEAGREDGDGGAEDADSDSLLTRRR